MFQMEILFICKKEVMEIQIKTFHMEILLICKQDLREIQIKMFQFQTENNVRNPN